MEPVNTDFSPAPKPFGWYCELIDTSTGEIVKASFTRVDPSTLDEPIEDCIWRITILTQAPPSPKPLISDEEMGHQLAHAKMGLGKAAWHGLHPAEKASWIDVAKAARKILRDD